MDSVEGDGLGEGGFLYIVIFKFQTYSTAPLIPCAKGPFVFSMLSSAPFLFPHASLTAALDSFIVFYKSGPCTFSRLRTAISNIKIVRGVVVYKRHVTRNRIAFIELRVKTEDVCCCSRF